MVVCLIKIGGTFLKMMTISGIILCNKEDKEFIYTNSKLKEDFSIIIYEEGTHDNTIVKVIKKNKFGLPSMFGEKIILEDNEKHTNSRLCEYIRRNDNSDYAMFVCIFPYIIINKCFAKTVHKFIEWICIKFSIADENSFLRKFEIENDIYFDPEKN